MKSANSVVSILRRLAALANGANVFFEDLKFNQGIMLTQLNASNSSKRLIDYEFKVFSQWGEDGILQKLTSILDIREKTFIEFGVEDFTESNCRFLLMKDNWRGFVIDGSPKNIRRLKQSYFFWKFDLVAISAFVTRDNINDLLKQSGFGEDIGILSIDLDGNDYHILESIKGFRPRILVCEYNAVFGPSRRISVPYEADFVRTRKHCSNLYFGASLSALEYLAQRKGYSLVGTNSAGCNAFFVRNDLLGNHFPALSATEGFTPSRFRESRDRDGVATYLNGDARLKAIEGLPVLNVETGAIENL